MKKKKEWEYIEPLGRHYDEFMCPVCGSYFTFSEKEQKIITECPHCHAELIFN